MIVGVALNEPLTEGHEFDGRVLLVEGQALARDGVVLVKAVLVATGLQVVRIILVHASEVREDGLFLTSRVQQQLDVLVKLSPLLGLLGLLRVLIAEVVDDVGRLSVSLGLGSGAATLDEVAGGALAFGPIDGRQGSWWQLAGERGGEGPLVRRLRVVDGEAAQLLVPRVLADQAVDVVLAVLLLRLF